MNIFKLIGELAEVEERLQETQFVAPCVPGGKVRTRIDGLVRDFAPAPAVFEGWGVFSPEGKSAQLLEEASLATVERYLELFEALRVVLVRQLEGRTWLAYPANTSDMAQRFGRPEPLLVRLVEQGREFDVVVARFDGGAWWYEAIDRAADPRIAVQLREVMRHMWHPNSLRISGLTPEMRTAYGIMWRKPDMRHFDGESKAAIAKQRLKHALEMGGGELRSYSEGNGCWSDGYWNVEWTTPDGEVHYSAIGKEDLTVMSAGICLSGRDADFDLQSLVGVVDGRHRHGWR